MKNVFLHITRECNLRCTYCYSSSGIPMRNELSSQELARLWGEIAALQPEKVIFTGGEPLSRPDLVDLLGGLRQVDPERRIRSCLNTNGILVTQAVADRLHGLVDEVRISLDGMRERNDRLRGHGSFDAAIRALGILQKASLEPSVTITLTSEGAPDLRQLLSFLVSRGVTHIRVNLLAQAGRAEEHRELELEIDAGRNLLGGALGAIGATPGGMCSTREPDTRPHCGVGHFLNILPNGDVFPCHVLMMPEFRCGNLREAPLREIADRHLLERLRTLDFEALAAADLRLAALVRPFNCLGRVYAETHQLSVWKRVLPLLQP